MPSQITVNAAIIDTEPSSPNADHSTSTMSRNPNNSSESKDPIGKQENNATSITQTQPPSSPATPGPSIDETTNQNSPEVLDLSNLSSETPPSQSANSPSTPGTSLTQSADKDLKDLAKYLSSPLKPLEESDSPQKEVEKAQEKDSLTVKKGKSKDGATAQETIDLIPCDGDGGQLAQEAVKGEFRRTTQYNLRKINKNKAKKEPSPGGGDDDDDGGDGSDDDNDSGLSSNDDDSSNENEDDSAYIESPPKKKKKQRKVKKSKSTDDEREKAESYEKIRKRIDGDWNNFLPTVKGNSHIQWLLD